MFEQFHDFFLVPEVVAGRDDIHAGGKDFLGGPGRDAGAASGIFSVRNDEIEGVLFAEFWHEFLDGAPAGLPDDVTNEEKFHVITVMGASDFNRRKRFNAETQQEFGAE